MARSEETIQANIDAIRAAMASSVLKVRHGDTETTYKSNEDMAKALAALLAELNDVSDTPVRQVRFKTSRGLD